MQWRRLWVLGAPDPEMEAIERLLREAGEKVVYAVGEDGQRVRPGNAYRAILPRIQDQDGVKTLYLVECDIPRPDWAEVEVVVVDHHRPGDPGYGRPPEEFLAASSIGQVIEHLAKLGKPVDISTEILFTAAADHCLMAAYRGKCPGVDPDALMRWRAESRARHQGRSVEEVLADIEAAREALRNAPEIVLYKRTCWVHRTYEPLHLDCSSEDFCTTIFAKDMRGRHVPELTEASAREGICFIADGLPDKDGRVKIICQSGEPWKIRAFMEHWAPANGLKDIYGDPARGFAGGYYDATLLLAREREEHDLEP